MVKQNFINEFLRQGAVVSTSQKKILLGWGKVEKHTHPKHHRSPYFYSSNFFLNEASPWHIFENNLEITKEEFIEHLIPFSHPRASRVWINPYKALFRETLEDIRKRILLGHIQKAVPFIYELSPTCMTTNQLAASLIKACTLIEKYPLHLYGFWQNKEGLLGLTPEILCSVKNTQGKSYVDCHALAGTKDLRHKSCMTSDPKTWNEHDIVRIGILEALKDLGKITYAPPEELHLPSFTHLKTAISLEMDHSPDLPQLINRLHPTPALGAFPRPQGLAWLKQYQTLIDRKKFGAPIGYVLPQLQEAHFFVAIRNVQWTSNEMRIGAGCGIVAGSRFEDEWYEVHLKLQSIKKALSL